MLYDNALLGVGVPRRVSGDRRVRYARVVRETIDYVLREMTHPDGGFYSTQDADSEGEEGKFFVWTESEIESVSRFRRKPRLLLLLRRDARGKLGRAQYPQPRQNARAGRAGARAFRDRSREIACRQSQKALCQSRRTRASGSRRKNPCGLERPDDRRDGAVPAACSTSRGSRPPLPASADFLLKQLRTPEGRLLHVFKDGKARLAAYLDDYACAIDALVEVYQATFDPGYVAAGAELADDLIARFSDKSTGGFFYTAHDHERAHRPQQGSPRQCHALGQRHGGLRALTARPALRTRGF